MGADAVARHAAGPCGQRLLKPMWQATWEAKNDSQASARDWLDPYTIDFNSDFYRGKPLNADVIAAGIKADEARILGMGARLRVAADQGARRREGGEFRGPRAAGGAARGRGGDWRRRTARSGTDAGAGGAGERGDRRGAWGAGGIQYLTDRYRGGDWAGFERGVMN
jgi:hypothetical protein